MRTYPIKFTCDVRSYHFGERLIFDLLGKRDVPAGVVAAPGR
jgi:mannose-6-phosphate isomerase